MQLVCVAACWLHVSFQLPLLTRLKTYKHVVVFVSDLIVAIHCTLYSKCAILKSKYFGKCVSNQSKLVFEWCLQYSIGLDDHVKSNSFRIQLDTELILWPTSPTNLKLSA